MYLKLYIYIILLYLRRGDTKGSYVTGDVGIIQCESRHATGLFPADTKPYACQYERPVLANHRFNKTKGKFLSNRNMEKRRRSFASPVCLQKLK